MSQTVPYHVRAAVLARAQFRCERCGVRMMVGLHMSHRKPRGMGGGSGRHAALSNINALCPGCHLGYVEKNPHGSLRDGWKVPQWEEPGNVAVRLFSGWAYLRDDGSMGSPPLAG